MTAIKRLRARKIGVRKSKKATALVSAVLPFLIAGLLAPFFFKKMIAAGSSYKLKEPMLIATSTGEPFSMIPKNTVLHFQQGYAEGHQLYTIEVFFKGKLPADELRHMRR